QRPPQRRRLVDRQARVRGRVLELHSLARRSHRELEGGRPRPLVRSPLHQVVVGRAQREDKLQESQAFPGIRRGRVIQTQPRQPVGVDRAHYRAPGAWDPSAERRLRSVNRYVVWACGSLAKAKTLDGSIRNTAAASSPAPTKTPSPTSKCHTLPYFASYASASDCRASRSVTRTAVPSTTMSRPRAQVLFPVVSATSRRASRLRAFCSRSPVQKCTAPSCATPISGVTCGRPSARIVVSQYSSGRSSSFTDSDHGLGRASGAHSRLSISGA